MSQNKNNNISVGKAGMNRDSHPSTINESEYIIALNTNIENESGNGLPMLQNEHSNVLCSKFKEGFKVVGFKTDLNSKLTYFFLKNESNGISEIGFINDSNSVNIGEDIITDCNCEVSSNLHIGLESQSQQELCNYTTITSTSCSKCLNFSINYPIHDIIIKDEKLGKTLYWTDNYNPPMHIQLGEDNSIIDCNECNDLRIFPIYSKPCLKVDVVEYGGRLKQGVYEFLVAYCDNKGNEVTQYFSITSPISIFDKNNIIVDGNDVNTYTNYGIKLSINDLDSKFKYYKIVAIQTNNLNSTTSYFIEGVHPITDRIVHYNSDINLKRTTLNNILIGKVHYTHSKGMTSSNGYLFQYGLKAMSEVNLQPVVNLMGAFFKWQTVIANEDIYDDEVLSSNYRGYMRDEVYPFSIRFISDEGYETSLFPMINRPSSDYDNEVIDNKDTLSLNSIGGCKNGDRYKRWQVYNTATFDGICEVTDGVEYNTITSTDIRVCKVNNVANSGSGEIILYDVLKYINLEQYIEDNITEICDINSDKYNAQICNLINSTYPSQTCIGDILSSNCSLTITNSYNVIDDVINESVLKTPKTLNDYTHLMPAKFCNYYTIDLTDGSIDTDDDFKDEFLIINVGTFKKVYKREDNYNEDCNYPVNIPHIFGGNNTLFQPFHINYYGANNLVDLQLNYNATDTNTYFTNKLHKGAIWFSGNFNDGQDKVILEIVKAKSCNKKDNIPYLGADDKSNENKFLRVSIFDKCSDSTPIQCQIIDTDSGNLFELDINNFSNSSYLVAIDAPIKEANGSFLINNTSPKYRTVPICGCPSIVSREIEYSEIKVNYDDIVVDKIEEYDATCEYNVPILKKCSVVPYSYGKFGYNESVYTYPDNEELYNSSNLNINESDLPSNIKSDFESYYVLSNNGGNYVLNSNTDFRDNNIRHYKFPDSSISEFINSNNLNLGKDSIIYPIGVSIDNEVVNAFLDIAVKNGLISQDLRSKLTKYEIFRGDRVLNKGIIAKGLLYDVYKYKENNKYIHYSNYPYNDLGSDILNYEDKNRNNFVPHPYNGESNNKFTFHSPDTHFHKPNLPNEINFEGYQFGNSVGVFNDVEGHSKWVILGKSAYTTASVLGGVEAALEAAIKIGELSVINSGSMWFLAGVSSGGGFAGSAVGGASILALSVAIGLSGFVKIGRYRYEWIKLFEENGDPKQFASYYTSVGKYNFFKKNTNDGNKLRKLNTVKYLKDGRYSISNNITGNSIRFNNVDRESTVFLDLGDNMNFEYDTLYKTYDNSSINKSLSSRFTSDGYCDKGESREFNRNIASPYVSLKTYNTGQYGYIDDIKWLTTSACLNLNNSNNCNPIFGGDIFITRFSLKRKIPFFLSNAMDLAPLTPFSYSNYSNIGSAKYYCDYNVGTPTTFLGSLFPGKESNYKFSCLTGKNKFYVRPPSKFYLYYYGISNFLVESEVNNNFRHAKKGIEHNFYPNIGDYVNWTQEKNVSIRNDNYYYYNNAYSKSVSRVGYRTLPSTYDSNTYNKLYDSPNGVIYSVQDTSEQNLIDPWLIYKPLDFHQFPTRLGKLVSLKDIESSQILGRFENSMVLFNAIDTLRERLTPDNIEIGNGGVFNQRPLEFKSTDLGYAGTYHKSMVSCEFGHFWVDTERGQVFRVNQNGRDLKEITKGLRGWFKINLPFKILNQNIEGLNISDLDNNFKGIGITMGWDSRYKRVFITKKDYVVNENFKNKIFYENKEFYFENNIVDLTDPTYFEDVSFTVAYSVITNTWISYYSFLPDYYISHNYYFNTGINYSSDKSEEGLWSHLLSNKSYQVFYGKLYPWIIELPNKNLYTNKRLESIEYWLDSKRYKDDSMNFAEDRKIGFNKAYIYNNSNNSGELNLVPAQKNNLYQSINYPKIHDNYTEILATENENKWTFNDFYNRVINENNNINIWNNDNNNIHKSINNSAISYKQSWLDRIRGDWNIVRLVQDKESRYKLIFKWLNNKNNIY